MARNLEDAGLRHQKPPDAPWLRVQLMVIVMGDEDSTSKLTPYRGFLGLPIPFLRYYQGHATDAERILTPIFAQTVIPSA